MPAEFDISPVLPEVPRQQPTPSVPPQQFQPPSGFSPMSRKKSNRLLKWFALAGAVLFVLAISSLWWGGSSFSDSGVILKLEVPEDHATSGDEVIYTATWRNDTRVTLSDLRFRMFYAPGTIVLDEEGNPSTPESEGFTVDRLEPGQEETREFRVFLIGDKGEIKTARLNVIYDAGTFQSSFQKEVSLSTAITDLPVTLTLVAPPTAVSGQSVRYILDARNDTDANLTAMRIQFTYPDGFTPTNFSPQPSSGVNAWTIASLAAGQGKRIIVDGTLAGSERETKTVTVALQRQLNGQYIDYVRTESFTVISGALLSVSIAPSQGTDYVSAPGDDLRYVVRYENKSRYTLLGLVLGVKLEGEMYDFSGIQPGPGFFDDSSKTVLFDAGGVPQFSSLAPGQSGTIIFTVPLKSATTGLGGTTSLFVKATAIFRTLNVPSGVDVAEVSTADSVVTKIGSRPSAFQTLLYDGGAGSGPLPPKVGEATTLTVRWQASNPGNDVSGARMTATLAPGVTWQGNAVAINGGSSPTYNPSSRTVTWDMGTLPQGIEFPRYEARFQIAVMPSSNQVGDLVPLLLSTILNGTDAFTGQAIQVTTTNVTTGNIDGHSGQGRVEE